MELSVTIRLICYFVVLLGLSGYGIHRYILVYLFLKNSKQKLEPQSEFDELPMVTIQLPIFNELHVVERLIRKVGELDYPKDKMQIQVLDDSTDETLDICRVEVEALAAKGFDIELIHRTDRTGFKAGALENGMEQAKGDYIYILDADFVPAPDALKQMIHYFTDEKVGMIQTRWGHINRQYSVFTRIQAMFLDGHLMVEQTARSRSGRFFNFNGTAGMWRKSCIIDAGGWQHDTLTEDLDLSYRAQLKSWKFIFLKDVVTPAELPVDMDGFKSQQHRWAKGSIQTCKKMLGTVWKSDMPLFIKLEATAHLTANFAYLLLLFLLVLIFPGMMPDMTWHRALLLDIPIFLMASVSVAVFYTCSQIAVHPRGKWLREVMLLPMLLGLGIGMSINNGRAVIEAIFNKESDFVRTPKYGIEKKRQDWRKSSYRALKSFAPLLEIALAFYFTFLVIYCMVGGMWMSVPFMMLFQFGFFYVSWDSLRGLFPFRSDEPDPV